MKKFSRMLILGLAAFAGWGVMASAARAEVAGTSGGDYVGLILGPTFISNNVGTKFAIGADLNVMMYENFGGGLYFTYNSLGSVGTINTSLVNLLAEGNYFVPQFPGLHVGAKLGLGFTSSSTTVTGGGGSSGTDLVLGPAVAYDHPLAEQFSVGAETNLLFLTSSTSLTIFNVLGAVKYWF